MDKLKLILTFIILIGCILGGLHWVSITADEKKVTRMETVETGFKYSKGLIVEKHSYKGHSIKLRYQIGNKVYEQILGWDNNPKNLRVGDSILFKYAVKDPGMIITELEKAYY